MSREDTRVPDLVLERYRLHELPAAEAEWLEGRLREDQATAPATCGTSPREIASLPAWSWRSLFDT